MSEPHDSGYPLRRQVLDLALQQVGSHYAWGASGNIPGESFPYPPNHNAVMYSPNDFVPATDLDSSGALTSRPRQHANRGDRRVRPIMFAAWCRVDGDKVCAGNSARPRVSQHGDPNTSDHTGHPGNYLWPRPLETINNANAVWGEACTGIRHFDCVHFLSWLFYQVLHQRFNREIWQYTGRGGQQGATRDVGFDDIWACDVLTRGASHIGLALADGAGVVEASDTQHGVIVTHGRPTARSWSRCGRLPTSFWRISGA